MNIKDIARIAGVSTTTVSKILNNKDSDISEETRKRVLSVIKEYQYMPFSKIRQNAAVKSNLLGIIISEQKEGLLELIRGIEAKAEQNGYSVIVCNMSCEAGKIDKNIKVLLSKNVEGIILIGKGSLAIKDIVVPLVSVNAKEKERKRKDVSHIYYDMKEAGELATQYLVSQGHRKIGCLLTEQDIEIESGYSNALYKNRISVEQMQIYKGTNAEEIANVGIDNCQKLDVTALICGNVQIACCAHRILQERGIIIPNEMSIIVMRDASIATVIGNGLSAIYIPDYEAGMYAAEKLIHCVESKEKEYIEQKIPLTLKERSSVAAPPPNRKREKIIVVGSMNVDVTISVPTIPADGETIIAEGVSVIPGGKGGNQAVGVGRLGGLVYMIGRLGNDSDGKTLYNSLLSHNVKTDGVVFDTTMPSGKAYINVDGDGESTIVVYSGANQNLNRSHIRQFRKLFCQARYCLLSMEILEDTAFYTANLCEKEGVGVILKPSGVKYIRDEMFMKVEYFVPNEKELNQLVQGDKTIEEKAQILLDKGVKNVIVTLGKKGCYFRNQKYSKFFPSANFMAVDTTGGADAFISALAVYLSEGNDIFHAIGFATYAAGISVTRQGVQPSLPDRIAVDAYQDDVNSRFSV